MESGKADKTGCMQAIFGQNKRINTPPNKQNNSNEITTTIIMMMIIII